MSVRRDWTHKTLQIVGWWQTKLLGGADGIKQLLAYTTISLDIVGTALANKLGSMCATI